MGELRSELFVKSISMPHAIVSIAINQEGNLPLPDYSPNIKLTSAVIKYEVLERGGSDLISDAGEMAGVKTAVEATTTDIP